LSQLIIGSTLENLIGFWRILAIYMISSVGGGLFSSLISGNSAVGASVAVLGMIGGYVNSVRFIDR
jgi:rhomboid protease GluP